MSRNFIKYKITGGISNEHHMIVMVASYDIRIMGEKKAVAHQAWSDLMANEKDEYGFELKPPRASSTARVLRKLCAVAGGPAKVFKKFEDTIVFQEVDDNET